MQPPEPAAVALRDALCAAIRNATLPLTTDELAKLMPRVTRNVWSNPDAIGAAAACFGDHLRFKVDPNIYLIECLGPGEHLLSFPCFAGHIYPHLQVLEKAGFCQRVRRAGAVQVHWMWVAPAWSPETRGDEVRIAAEFDALVAQLDLGDVDR